VKLYLAGPMSGIPQFNFPAFDAATKALRALGHSVVSPHEEDTPAAQAAAWASPDGKHIDGGLGGETWAQILARDIVIVADKVDGVVFLPGWDKSRGARLEAFVGLLCQKKFYTYPDMVARGGTWIKVHLL
jgi:hypothetical protein